MNLLQHSTGIIIAVGFDMAARKADPYLISWSDTDGETWETALENCAGEIAVGWPILGGKTLAVEHDNDVYILADGMAKLKLRYLGKPYVFGIEAFEPVQGRGVWEMLATLGEISPIAA